MPECLCIGLAKFFMSELNAETLKQATCLPYATQKHIRAHLNYTHLSCIVLRYQIAVSLRLLCKNNCSVLSYNNNFRMIKKYPTWDECLSLREIEVGRILIIFCYQQMLSFT